MWLWLVDTDERLLTSSRKASVMRLDVVNIRMGLTVPLVRNLLLVFSRKDAYRLDHRRWFIPGSRSITKCTDQVREAVDKMWIQIPSIRGLEQ